MRMPSSPPSTGLMCRVVNYALSIKRYCRPERRNESNGRKLFGACVPCSSRRNTSNSNTSRRLNRISTISPSLLLPSLPNVRTRARIINLRNSILHPQRHLCRPHSHMPSKRLRPRCPSHLVLLSRAALLQMSWTSMTHLRWRSTRVFYFSKMITCETSLRFPERSLQSNDESYILLLRSLVYITIPSVKVMSVMQLSLVSTQKRFVRSNSPFTGLG